MITLKTFSKKKIEKMIKKLSVATAYTNPLLFVRIFFIDGRVYSALLFSAKENSLIIRICGGKEKEVPFDKIKKICFLKTTCDFRDLAEELNRRLSA